MPLSGERTAATAGTIGKADSLGQFPPLFFPAKVTALSTVMSVHLFLTEVSSSAVISTVGEYLVAWQSEWEVGHRLKQEKRAHRPQDRMPSCCPRWHHVGGVQVWHSGTVRRL
jgi:hypothetical protein